MVQPIMVETLQATCSIHEEQHSAMRQEVKSLVQAARRAGVAAGMPGDLPRHAGASQNERDTGSQKNNQ